MAHINRSPGRFVDVVLTLDGGCGVTLFGDVECWKDYFEFQEPTKVPGLEQAVRVEARVQSLVCILDAEGRLSCGGIGGRRWHLPGADEMRFTDLAVASDHVCALNREDERWCWVTDLWKKVDRSRDSFPVLAVEHVVELLPSE